MLQSFVQTVSGVVVATSGSFGKFSSVSSVSQTAKQLWNSSNHSQFDHLPQYTLSEVSEHWQQNDCWIIIDDLVYDVTKFLDEHPGGSYIIMEHAGRDATLAFRGSRHSEDAFDMLKSYLVGVLVESERLYLATIKTKLNDTRIPFGSPSAPSIGL